MTWVVNEIWITQKSESLERNRKAEQAHWLQSINLFLINTVFNTLFSREWFHWVMSLILLFCAFLAEGLVSCGNVVIHILCLLSLIKPLA